MKTKDELVIDGNKEVEHSQHGEKILLELVKHGCIREGRENTAKNIIEDVLANLEIEETA